MDSTRGSLRPPFANALFFPAACLYGALAVPLWLFSLLGGAAWAPGFTTPQGHAHEMLFGYALAVVAGYLLGPQPLRTTGVLLGLWAGARACFLIWPGSWLSVAFSAAFAAGVAVKVAPRFAMSARKWRNRIVAPAVVALAVLAAAGSMAMGSSLSRAVLLSALVLLSVLMFFMGGRIIAPAVAGHLKRSDRPLAARVQPRLEGAGLVCLLATLALLPVPGESAAKSAGYLLMAAGAIALVRLLRWRLWNCRDRADLLVLAAGYAWLGIGLFLLGLALIVQWPLTGALHALAVGALGTLTAAVMVRTRLLYRYRDANVMPIAHWATLLMTVAAVARLASVLPAFAPHSVALLTLSAVFWSVALLIVCGVVLKSLAS